MNFLTHHFNIFWGAQKIRLVEMVLLSIYNNRHFYPPIAPPVAIEASNMKRNLTYFPSFMSNEISHHYPLDESISITRVVG